MSEDNFLQDIITQIKKDALQEEEKKLLLIQKALDEIELLKKDFLMIDPDMERLVLFGSLAQTPSSSNFDIDLAVKSKKYFALLNRALSSDFKIDLVDIDFLNPFILKTIEQKGKIIYEKN